MANEVERLINEPLPMVHETIVARYPLRETQAKKALARQILSLKPNYLHKELMNLGSPILLTTNYDYNLESSSDEPFSAGNMKPETTYSLFRCRTNSAKKVWHIHGEMTRPGR